MNRIYAAFAFFFVFLLFVKAGGQSLNRTLEKGESVHEWVEQHFAEGKIPPFSFVYGGKSSDNFIIHWQYRVEKMKSTDPAVEETVYTYLDKQSGLMVKCTVNCFEDFPAVEWVLKLYNTSGKNTPFLQKVQVVDQEFLTIREGHFTLHHIKGSNGGKDDFLPREDTLKIGKKVSLAPADGRSSSNTAFPFFNIKSPASTGFVVAIGWTGKWNADICQTGKTTLSLKAGMERMKLILYPEEEIRTPSVCLLFWEGEEPMTGHNQFRNFVITHKTRANSLKPPIAASLSPNTPFPCNGFFGCLSDTFALAKIAQLKQHDIVPDVCWIDAGWYQDGGDNWQIIGNWNVEKRRFPHGLKPIADAIHAIDAKFLLWFEPERVVEGTQLAMEHEGWLLEQSGDIKNIYTGKRDFVFNLGLEEARLWLTDYISNILKNEEVDYYRQDFNFDPMSFWETNDKPDRIGISEIRHIEGLYAYWDSLLVRFPNLIIDNCASGGRRIDLETISRSSTLWRSDYLMDEPSGLQNHTFGLNYYIPFHGTGNLSYTPYEFRSSMSSSMVLFWDLNSSDRSFPQMSKCMHNFKRLRPYYHGDYYPLTLTENLLREDEWLAYQLNRPGHGDGIIIAFRRKNCNKEFLTVKLGGIDAKKSYELADEDSQIKITVSGEELIEGFKLTLNHKPGSLLIWYKRLPS